MSRTIFIRHRPAGCGVVVKPHHPGANDLGPFTYAEARAYADKLHEQHGYPVEDETPKEVRRARKKK